MMIHIISLLRSFYKMTKQILRHYYNSVSSALKYFLFKILIMGIYFHIPNLSEFVADNYWVPLTECTEVFEFYVSSSHFHSFILITSSLLKIKARYWLGNLLFSKTNCILKCHCIACYVPFFLIYFNLYHYRIFSYLF